MLNWLNRNADALSALGGLATALAALTALVVIPYQVAQADRIQRDQTAREIYREFLNLTVQKPELATADHCSLADGPEATAYAAYVEYLVYTAEQMIDTSDTWRAPMKSYLADHMHYLCSAALSETTPDGISGLMANLGLSCRAEHDCK